MKLTDCHALEWLDRPPSGFEADIMNSISDTSSAREVERAIFQIYEYRNDHTGICLIYDRTEGQEFASDLCRPVRYRTYDYEISHEDFQKFFRLNSRGEYWVKTNNLLTNTLFTKAECGFMKKSGVMSQCSLCLQRGLI